MKRALRPEPDDGEFVVVDEGEVVGAVVVGGVVVAEPGRHLRTSQYEKVLYPLYTLRVKIILFYTCCSRDTLRKWSVGMRNHI